MWMGYPAARSAQPGEARRIRAFRLLPLLLTLASTLAAQVPDSQPARPAAPAPAPQQPAAEPDRSAEAPWRTSYFPYLTGGANDGPVLVFRVRHRQPADYEARTTYTGAFNADAGIAPRGSRFVVASFRAPLLWPGWRLDIRAGAERQARYGYYGLGNQTVYDKDAITDATPFFYRMRRTRYGGTVEVTRRLRGPLSVALLTGAEEARFTALPESSLFATDFPSREVKQSDVIGRLALVYDTRDNEYNTHQGVLLEAGTLAGTGGDGYTRQYVVLRGYLPVREGTVIAARVAGSGMGGSPPLDARFYVPAWESSIPVLGGAASNRGLRTGRFTGRGVLLGNLEVRHDLLPFGDLGAITLLAFVDAGRVFEQESFKLTTSDMKVSGGGGVALRILRSSIFTFNFAGGPDGFNFSVGNGWMF